MDILDVIESFVNNTFLQMLLSIGIIAVLGIGLSIIGVSKMLIFLTIIVSILMFASFGWIPIWIVILISIGLFVMAFFTIKGGSNV